MKFFPKNISDVGFSFGSKGGAIRSVRSGYARGKLGVRSARGAVVEAVVLAGGVSLQ